MIEFDEKKQEDRLDDLRGQEEEELAQMLSQKYGIDYTDLTRTSIDADALSLVPEDVARKAELAFFRKIGKKVFVAMRAPERQDSLAVLQSIERLGYSIVRFIVSRASLERAWDRYKDISYSTESEAGVLTISQETIQKLINEINSIDSVKEQAERYIAGTDSHRISHVLEVIMAGALSLGASDVHLEPEESFVRMRYRLDGVLHEVLQFDHATYELVAARIKLLSGLKLNLKDIAQDGRLSIIVNDKEIEIRTSVLPGNYAETIVMRILDPTTIALSMPELGFDSYFMDIITHEIQKPNGMILNTGPTGSGKTTTLYAFLTAVHSSENKVVTIEDPVEYHLEGIVQTQVSKDYSFAQGLRSTLRQDPDVIMVGEIRDAEVATTAVQAALTGHLVFSTLHTNDAAGTFPRLIDFGIEAEVLGSSINIAMAQRLVRKLCTHCRAATPIAGTDRDIVERLMADIPHPEDTPRNRDIMWTATGCEECGGIGYKGRIAIVEAIVMDRTIEELLRKNPTEREIWEGAKHQEIRSMAQDGMVKVLRGITSLDELGRVIDLNA
ncbi:MAG TPA: GspE/PulE family protein [Candidatus Paceibacterota bacterium]|nr:GspE/PulE family protein [Candidatus Paceibacterota bacterium]